MPRKKKAQLPTVQVPRDGAVDRARKLAGFCKDNPNKMLKARSVLEYLNDSGKGGDPAQCFTVDKDDKIEHKE